MNKIIMMSDCTNNRYSQKDAIADRKWREKQEHKERVILWLHDNPQVGALNGYTYYIHDENGDYMEIEPLSDVSKWAW